MFRGASIRDVFETEDWRRVQDTREQKRTCLRHWCSAKHSRRVQEAWVVSQRDEEKSQSAEKRRN